MSDSEAKNDRSTEEAAEPGQDDSEEHEPEGDPGQASAADAGNGEADAGEGAAKGDAGAEPAKGASEKSERSDAKKDKYFWHWVAGIVVVLCVELFIYGRNGRIEVCVGQEGLTDWALLHQPKDPKTFAKAPRCAHRMNLGMYGDSEEAARAALDEACARATMTNHVARTHCVRREKKWTRQVFKEHIPPWDERLYKRLLWLD